MQIVKRYPFEYFCGANVVVYLDDFPLLEASGFSYSIRESKRPIYGYASRLYDGVARGQVLVEGTLLVNYVHQDYLFHAASLALDNASGLIPLPTTPPPSDQTTKTVHKRLLTNGDISEREINEAKQYYWGEESIDQVASSQGMAPTYNLHDASNFSIRVGFGAQTGDRPSGDTGFLLTGLHFTGRAQTIQIDAETIVEAYSFFARNVYSTKNPQPLIVEKMPNGNTLVTR